MIVVDASVAVKWYTPEPASVVALEVFSGHEELFGPAIMRVEVASALVRKARFGEIKPVEALIAIGLWTRALVDRKITIMPETPDMDRAVAIALELNHPLQDCLYLALAERLNVPLITADRKFADKANTQFSRVQLLARS